MKRAARICGAAIASMGVYDVILYATTDDPLRGVILAVGIVALAIGILIIVTSRRWS